jgi:myo-inositol-1(or 4)-monophosphatase
MPVDLHAFAAFAHDLADAARAAILPLFRASATIDKGDAVAFDRVTEAYRAAERAMRALIESRFPDHGLLGEEYGERPARSAYSWTLDPIDGTRAFISGVPVWGTLIALTEDGRPILGVIDQGYLDERYIGHGGAAEMIVRGVRTPLKIRSCASLAEATLSSTSPDLFHGAEAGAFEMVRHAARLTRYGCDCYAYAQLAAGRMDLVIESGLKPWDVHALVPIVEGAGGAFVNWRGEPAWSGGQVLAVGDQRLLAPALIALRRAAN